MEEVCALGAFDRDSTVNIPSMEDNVVLFVDLGTALVGGRVYE